MLVLSRKNDQAVVIGAGRFENILKVTVLGISAGRVTLGFAARGNVVIHRHEVWDKIRANGRSAHPNDGCTTSKEELNRWEDDGGYGTGDGQCRTVSREMKVEFGSSKKPRDAHPMPRRARNPKVRQARVTTSGSTVSQGVAQCAENTL